MERYLMTDSLGCCTELLAVWFRQYPSVADTAAQSRESVNDEHHQQ